MPVILPWTFITYPVAVNWLIPTLSYRKLRQKQRWTSFLGNIWYCPYVLNWFILSLWSTKWRQTNEVIRFRNDHMIHNIWLGYPVVLISKTSIDTRDHSDSDSNSNFFVIFIHLIDILHAVDRHNSDGQMNSVSFEFWKWRPLFCLGTSTILIEEIEANIWNRSLLNLYMIYRVARKCPGALPSPCARFHRDPNLG
jgi:hypothetical protein